MKRIFPLALLIGVLFYALAQAEPANITIGAGVLRSGSEAERSEGGFTIGQRTYIVVEPSSPFWHRLLENEGKVVTLKIVVE